ncbi:hypothetical protein MPH_07766, partial [Macrophomina phaseolina MS6]
MISPPPVISRYPIYAASPFLLEQPVDFLGPRAWDCCLQSCQSLPVKATHCLSTSIAHLIG